MPIDRKWRLNGVKRIEENPAVSPYLRNFFFFFSFSRDLKRSIGNGNDLTDQSFWKECDKFYNFSKGFTRAGEGEHFVAIFADNRPGIRCTCLNCPAIIPHKKRRRRSYLDGSTSFSSRPVAVISRKRIGRSLESGQDSFRRTCLDGYQLANVPRALNKPCETHVERVYTRQRRYSGVTFKRHLLPDDRTISHDPPEILSHSWRNLNIYEEIRLIRKFRFLMKIREKRKRDVFFQEIFLRILGLMECWNLNVSYI